MRTQRKSQQHKCDVLVGLEIDKSNICGTEMLILV